MLLSEVKSYVFCLIMLLEKKERRIISNNTKESRRSGCVAPEELLPKSELLAGQGTKVGVTEAFDQSSTSTPQQSLMDGTNRGVGREWGR